MKDNIRIYYNTQCIFIAHNASELLEQKGLQNYLIVRNGSKKDLKESFETFSDSGLHNLIIEGNVQEIFSLFKKNFEEIVAGGGVVWNNEDQLLMIHRLSKWDLPKGKLDPGEDIAQCAVREVEEETGLDKISLKDFIRTTYHIYNMRNLWILKRTEWYEMRAPIQELIPQAEEDITEAVWVPRKEVSEKLGNSYPNIIYLLRDIV